LCQIEGRAVGGLGIAVVPGGDVARPVVAELHAEEMLVGRFETLVEVGGVVDLGEPAAHLVSIVDVLDATAQGFARQLTSAIGPTITIKLPCRYITTAKVNHKSHHRPRGYNHHINDSSK